MDFGIAEPFTDRPAKLTGEEQKAVKTTDFDLQLNLENSVGHARVCSSRAVWQGATSVANSARERPPLGGATPPAISPNG
jgi:hypothetical protein